MELYDKMYGIVWQAFSMYGGQPGKMHMLPSSQKNFGKSWTCAYETKIARGLAGKSMGVEQCPSGIRRPDHPNGFFVQIGLRILSHIASFEYFLSQLFLEEFKDLVFYHTPYVKNFAGNFQVIDMNISACRTIAKGLVLWLSEEH